MTPEQLAQALHTVLTETVAAGDLTVEVPSADAVRVERPRSREHGDWATNVALQLGKKAGMAPRDLAGLVAERLTDKPGIAAVDVAGPGFLNVTLDAASAGALAREIVEAHGGRITLGHREGGGLRIVLTLPVLRPAVAAVTSSPTG